MNEAQRYARDVVRKGHPDRYIATLYAPVEKRGDLLALYAFDAEIAQIRRRASEPLPGEIRLQWWRDIIGGERADEGAGHPTAAALLDTISRCQLPRSAFDNLIEARIFELYDDPMPTRNDLEGYCGDTVSSIFQMAAVILDGKLAQDCATTAGHAGVASGLSDVLRRSRADFVQYQKFVPEDVLQAAGTGRQEFLRGASTDVGQRPLEIMTALANEHLTGFQAGARSMPRELLPAFLPMAPVAETIGRITAGKTAEISDMRRQFTILWRAIRGWR